MGDRCYLEMTLRREDLARFAPHVGATAGEEWWDDDNDTEDPELACVSVYDAEIKSVDA